MNTHGANKSNPPHFLKIALFLPQKLQIHSEEIPTKPLHSNLRKKNGCCVQGIAKEELPPRAVPKGLILPCHPLSAQSPLP